MRGRCLGARAGLAAVVLAALTGCGSKQATVEGSVSYDSQPLTHGTVSFIGADGRVDSAQIQPDGTYKATRVPPGEAVITVQTYPLPPQVQPPDQPAPKEPPNRGEARYVRIPALYADAKRSPLRLTVQSGSQTHDLKLTKTGK